MVEPFAGSAAVTLAAACSRRSRTFLINDSNIPLMRLWSSIVNEPEEISAVYTRLWRSQLGREREYYTTVRRRFNETQEPYYLLYLLARCVKAAIRYNSKGEFNQSPDNRRRGMKPSTMGEHIGGASKLLRETTEITTGEDYRNVLAAVEPGDVVYMDPPYQGVCLDRDHRYKDKVGREEFVVALRDLNARSIPYLVSYDGRTGSKTFGDPLPDDLGLELVEVAAGRSSQATLLGRSEQTVESLYLSPALLAHPGFEATLEPQHTLALFGADAWLNGSTLPSS